MANGTDRCTLLCTAQKSRMPTADSKVRDAPQRHDTAYDWDTAQLQHVGNSFRDMKVVQLFNSMYRTIE